jgi:hypothetical protein
VFKEFFREVFVVWEVPIEQANSEADLGFGHLLRGHNRELERCIRTRKEDATKVWKYGPIVPLED